jgi:chromosome partitioning protein
VDKRAVQGSTYEALLDGDIPSASILYNERLQLSLLPSSPSLAGAEVELVEETSREFRLRDALEPLIEKYDYILIDCPPSLGLLTVNGLIAARDGVLVPVQCEYLALEGLGQLTQTIQRVQSSLFQPECTWCISHVRYERLSAMVKEVNNHFPGQVFVSSRSIRLAEAPSKHSHLPASSSVGACLKNWQRTTQKRWKIIYARAREP